MIEFACPSCGEAMAVPDSLAGGEETCPACNAAVTVPSPARRPAAPPPHPAPPAPAAAVLWHCARDGTKIGVYSAAQVREYLAAGRLVRTDHVWKDGMSAWVPLADVAELSAPASPAAAEEPAWFFARDGRQSGPFTLSHMRRALAEGRILPTDHVWKGGMPQWIPASAARELSASSHAGISASPRAAAPTAQAGISGLVAALDGGGEPATPRMGTVRLARAVPASSGGMPMIELAAGVLLVLTFIIPWMHIPDSALMGQPKQTIMSWDILKESDTPGMLVALLVIAWVIGVAALVLGAVLKPMEASIAHTALGFLGLIFLLVLAFTIGADSPLSAAQTGGTASKVLMPFGFIFGLGLVVITHLRLRLGDGPALRIAQGVFAGGTVIISLINMILTLVSLSDVPPGLRAKIAGAIIFMVLICLASIAGAVMSFLHSLRVGPSSRHLSRIGLALIYGSAIAMGIYLVVMPAVMLPEGLGGIALMFLNIVFIAAGFLILTCSGLIKLLHRLLLAAAGGVPAATQRT